MSPTASALRTFFSERNEALEASDRLKTTFLSHVSYELRTPLTTIIGFTDLLAEPAIGPLKAKQREYLNDIKTSSQALLNIINDILDLAVIDAGALDLKLSPVDLQQAIEAAELGVRERLQRAKVHLQVHVAKEAATVMADENRLIQVLYNLLSNAIGFSPEDGTITLSCRSEKNGISISVQDTGLGIPEEEQATVFERFEVAQQGLAPSRRRPWPVACKEHRRATQRPHRFALDARRRDDRYHHPAPQPPRLAAKDDGCFGKIRFKCNGAIITRLSL